MRFRSDQRGAVSIVTALGLTTLLGAAAFGLDLSRLYGTQRRVQGAADLAALSAASDLSTADAAARRALADNGFGDGTRIGVQAGAYLRSAAVANGSRFHPRCDRAQRRTGEPDRSGSADLRTLSRPSDPL